MDPEKDSGNENLVTDDDNSPINPDESGQTGYVIGTSDTKLAVPDLVNVAGIKRELRERDNAVERDELVVKVRSSSEPREIADQILVEISKEIAHLKYDRKRLLLEGKNTSNITISRISALKQMCDALMKKMENSRSEALDLKSPRFRMVLKHWMEFVYQSMEKSNLSQEVIDLVFRQMEADMEDWERRITESPSLNAYKRTSF